MKKPETYYIVVKGGYQSEPTIYKTTITKEDIDMFLKDNGMEEEDAINEILSDIVAEFGQNFSLAMTFTEEEFKELFSPNVIVIDYDK